MGMFRISKLILLHLNIKHKKLQYIEYFDINLKKNVCSLNIEKV